MRICMITSMSGGSRRVIPEVGPVLLVLKIRVFVENFSFLIFWLKTLFSKNDIVSGMARCDPPRHVVVVIPSFIKIRLM